MSESYEPLGFKDFRTLTEKMCFLVALATARE